MRGLAFAIATCYDATLNEGTPIIMRMHWLRNILRERGFASPDVAFQISANASDSGTHEEDLVSSGEEEGHGGEGEDGGKKVQGTGRILTRPAYTHTYIHTHTYTPIHTHTHTHLALLKHEQTSNVT
jgi:hypothetical protein